MTHAQLVRRFGSASAAIDALPSVVAAQPSGRRISVARRDDVERERVRLDRLGGEIVLPLDEAFPRFLLNIPDTPPVLSVLGRHDVTQLPGIGIVGARNASAAGRRIAGGLATSLGENGFGIISGLARGIDGAAHEAALPYGTIAVLAGGVDQVYPPEHHDLYRRIAEGGLVISEMALGFVARARDFPKRNRIVSGLSHAVVVVEAAERSGTLITARLALEQGREVCAVPGSPLDPRSAGTNGLIRQGATLVRDADDVLEAVGNFGRGFSDNQRDLSSSRDDHGGAQSASERSELRRNLLGLLGQAPVHRDILVRETGTSAAAVADVLLDLVLDGRAVETGGGLYTADYPTED